MLEQKRQNLFILINILIQNNNYNSSQIMSYTSYRQQNDIFKYKKRLPIKSLQAAICNVALFKNMKQKQFRDTIYISYCQDGVILESVNQNQWEKACGYVLDFLVDKKIALLTYGYEKEIYEQLIVKGLKQYTRRIKQQGDECPYINIIHYQKLRKSCEYMDKQRYMDPLKYWEHKFKINPNFSFLIVEPKEKFYEVKRYLLQVLLKKQVTLKIEYLTLWEYLYVLYSSKNKDQIRELCDKKILEVQLVKKKQIQDEIKLYNKLKSPKKEGTSQKNEEQQRFNLMKILDDSQYMVKIINFSDIILSEYEIKIIKHTSNLAKLGLEYISSKQIEKQIKTISKYLRGPECPEEYTLHPVTSTKKHSSIPQVYERLHKQILNAIRQQTLTALGQSSSQQTVMYSMIPYKRCEKEKYLNLLQKLLKTTTEMKNKNLEEINNELKKLEICEYDEIQFLSILPLNRNLAAQKNSRSPTKAKKGALKQRSLTQHSYHTYKVSINDCPYMVIEYHQIPINDLDTFILYLQQLKTYYCTYLVRFHGISIRYGQTIHDSHAQILSSVNPSFLQKIQKSQSHSFKQLSKSKLEEYSYYLIFDYHHRSMQTLIENDFILDNLQIANIALQILYLCQYLHSHDQPRCLGMISLDQTFWPLAMVLPYLGQSSRFSMLDDIKKNSRKASKVIEKNKFKLNCSEQGFEGDVKLLGRMIEHLMNIDEESEDDKSDNQESNQSIDYEQGTIDKQLQNLWKLMTKQSKYERITIGRAISILQEILCL